MRLLGRVFFLVLLAAASFCLQITMPQFLKRVWLSDYVVDNSPASVLNTSSLAACCQHCLQQTGCLTVFHHQDLARCVLLNRVLYSPEGGRFEWGWQYWMLSQGCPTEHGYVLEWELAFCFKLFYNNTGTWHECRDFCNQEGGHPVIVDSQAKHDALLTHIFNSSETAVPARSEILPRKRGYFMDLTYSEDVQDWVWNSTGQVLDDSAMTVWTQGEPNASRLHDNRVGSMLMRHSYLWSTTNADIRQAFICQIDV